MKLSEFETSMPNDLIATHPMPNRDESRLLVLHSKTGEMEHVVFKDIINYFDDKDMFIFNDTRVFPAKLDGNKEKTGAKIEVFLLRELNEEHKLWDVLVEPARKIRIGNKLYFMRNEDELPSGMKDDDNIDEMVAEVIDNTTSRGRTLRFLYDGPHDKFKMNLFAMGHTPLPYYIKRAAEPEDAEKYQTIFAKNEGAVVAPAAGMHFSRELLKRMEIKGIADGYITLHIGLGSYRDIDVEDLTKHRMDSEQMDVSEELSQRVNATRDSGHRICAVGTSTLRAMESTVGMNGHIKPFTGWTNKFIFPPYDFSTCDALVTNFHLPYSVMLMLTAAFGGYDAVMKAYDVAIKEKYRFGAYGDAMLILK